MRKDRVWMVASASREQLLLLVFLLQPSNLVSAFLHSFSSTLRILVLFLQLLLGKLTVPLH